MNVPPPPGDAAPEVLEDRIWIDGCFDFFHHGHAGAIVQARQLGRELYIGVHSDEDILENKGPTVMTLKERIAAVDACRWVTKSVPHAPYVTDLGWITHFGCQYVVHGDDITSDSSGEDCYRFVKAAGRFKVVKRTPSISTTDLVGRMLLCTRGHFIRSLEAVFEGREGPGTDDERAALGVAMKARMGLYATDETGKDPGVDVYLWSQGGAAEASGAGGTFNHLFAGKGARPGQRIVYVDGGFDLFSSGHIEFLRRVLETEAEMAREKGWYEESSVKDRVDVYGEDYGPAFVVAGVHNDEEINHFSGVNYPIMNIFERGLCVLQCKYIDSVIFGAPFTPTSAYLKALPFDCPSAVYHGPTSLMALPSDPYTAAKEMGIYHEIPSHAYQDVNAKSIVQRIMESRDMYEARQRAKGMKAGIEEAQQKREILEQEQKEREAARMG